MTWDEFKTHTMPLAVLLGAEWDAPTWKLYHRAVQSIPLPLYVAAVAEAAETRTHKMPTAANLRELAERARQQMLASSPHVACATCELTPGWVPVTQDGVERLARCECWQAWRASLDRLGLNGGPLVQPALPSGYMAPVGDMA